MYRLNKRAFEILKTEIERCSTDDIAGQVQKEIAFRRLEKLCNQEGTPLSLEELQDTIDDLFPDFSKKVLKAAAHANRPPSPTWLGIKVAVITVAGVAGGIWFLNLPYPPIRYPVSRIAPIVLLPSFMSMDHHYRQAIALTEQSDQLINQATSAADLELGSTKVKDAQKHLDALPVWFLGYYPQVYCGWFGCGWRFTLDEFQQARKEVARMDAKVFQEKNAQTQMEKADQTVGEAKQQYQKAGNSAQKQTAIAQWQQGMDFLNQVPGETLAGRMAKTKLQVYERDFQQATGLTAGNTRSGNLIQAAKAFANVAQQTTKGNAHSVAEWQEIQNQWQAAIDRIEQIKEDNPDYEQAQELLANYQQKQSQARIRLEAEKESVQAYEQAQQLTQTLLANAKSLEPNQVASQLQAIENQLDKVQPGTTVFAKAQTLQKSAENKRKQMQK
jgi:predicted translin family RNA/ssDNA-binding protein